MATAAVAEKRTLKQAAKDDVELIKANAAKSGKRTITVIAGELKAALTRIRPAVGKRSAVEALGCVRIVEELGGPPLVEGTDFDIAGSIEFVGEADTGFEAFVNHKELADAVGSFNRTEVLTLTELKDHGLEVRSGNTRSSLAPGRLADWPVWDKTKHGDLVWHGDASELADAVLGSVSHCSDEPTRPVLTSMLLDGDAGKIVATDSYRLLLRPLPGGTRKKFACKPVGKDLAIALKGRHEEGDGAMLYLSARELTLARTGELWSMRLVDGQWPNYQQLLPDRGASDILLTVEDADEWHEVASAAADAARKNTPVRVTAKLEDPNTREGAEHGRIPGSRVTVEFSVRVPDGPEYDGAAEATAEKWVLADQPYEFEIGCNPAYLQDMLAAMPYEEVEVRLISPLRPFVLVSGEVLGLLMPIRLNV